MKAAKLMTDALPAILPRVGMLATVHNRRGIIAAVEPFASGQKTVPMGAPSSSATGYER